jgi:hypothetical protein
MKVYLYLINKYLKSFIFCIGLAYLFKEFLNWFEYDSPLKIAGILIIANILRDFVNFLYSKYKNRNNISV